MVISEIIQIINSPRIYQNQSSLFINNIEAFE